MIRAPMAEVTASSTKMESSPTLATKAAALTATLANQAATAAAALNKSAVMPTKSFAKNWTATFAELNATKA